MPDRFSRTMATLDTSGGHILVSFVAILLGALLSMLRIPKSEDLIVAGTTGLFLSMRGRGAENHDYNSPQAGPLLPPARIL